MKPNSSHTISRLVCTIRATLNGMAGNRKSPTTYCRPSDQAKQYLPDEEADCRDEIGLRDGLGFVLHFHLLASMGNWLCAIARLAGPGLQFCGARVQFSRIESPPHHPSILGGHFRAVSISELYLREGHHVVSSWGVRLNWGIWRRRVRRWAAHDPGLDELRPGG